MGNCEEPGGTLSGSPMRDDIEGTDQKMGTSGASNIIFVQLVIGLWTLCPVYAAIAVKHGFTLTVNRLGQICAVCCSEATLAIHAWDVPISLNVSD